MVGNGTSGRLPHSMQWENDDSFAQRSTRVSRRIHIALVRQDGSHQLSFSGMQSHHPLILSGLMVRRLHRLQCHNGVAYSSQSHRPLPTGQGVCTQIVCRWSTRRKPSNFHIQYAIERRVITRRRRASKRNGVKNTSCRDKHTRMSFALFVSRNKKRPDELCPGSTLCTEFLQNIDEHEVEVIDCNRPDFKRPAWLKGTPTLYENETERTWTGHQAVRRLYHMSMHYAMTPPAKGGAGGAPPSRTAPPRGALPPRGAPPPPPPRDQTTTGGSDDAMDGSIWESQITPEIEDDPQEMETRSDRKMNADDLQRAMSERVMTNAMNANGDKPQTMNAPPPPPPALND